MSATAVVEKDLQESAYDLSEVVYAELDTTIRFVEVIDSNYVFNKPQEDLMWLYKNTQTLLEVLMDRLCSLEKKSKQLVDVLLKVRKDK